MMIYIHHYYSLLTSPPYSLGLILIIIFEGDILATINKASNSGIDALLGFEFQRNCALYLLLNDYEQFKERNFFICIEHHDDFLYCYRTNCYQLIEEVHAFQAKKLSGNVWSINERFSEILTKMLGVGISLKNDPIKKCKDYSHKLTFISNSNIELKYTPRQVEKKQGKKELVYTLNEQNCKCQYSTIPDEIKNKIKEKVITFCESNETIYHESELENLHIQWIDFPRTKKLQVDTLVGLMCRKFPHVFDPVAAVELLLSLFREVESTYNQGKIITLLDNSKRVEGDEIKLAIDIIENEQKHLICGETILLYYPENLESLSEYKTTLKITFEIHLSF